MNRPAQPRAASWLGLLAALLIYAPLAVVRLDLPGLHYDEALEAGLPAVQLLRDGAAHVVNDGVLPLGRLRLPLMVQNHIGAAQVYAALPLVALLGPTATALRAMTVLAGGLTIIAVYLFVLQISGRQAALYSALWLATFGSFVFWSRQGVFVTSLAGLWAAGALAAGARWWQVRRVGWAGLAGLCAGLAVYSKLSALWLLNGAVAWALLCWASTAWTRRGRPWPPIPRQAILAASLGLLLGLWPLLLYNLRTGGATLRVMQANATETYLGASNVDVLGNLVTRLGQAADVVVSGKHIWYLGGDFPNPIALLAVLSALLVPAIELARTRGQGWRAVLLVPFLALAVIVQSCYTISALWPTHFAVAVALPAVLFGMAVSRVQSWCGGARGRALVVLLAGVVLVSQAHTSLGYLGTLVRTGGLPFHSSDIYGLADFLDGHSEQVVALDWGIAAQVEYLTGGRVPVEEFYSYAQATPADFSAALQARFERGELYITHAANHEAFARRAAFLQAVTEAGRWADAINYQRPNAGWPMFEVWRVRKPGE